MQDSKRIEKAIAALANSPRKQMALKPPSFETFRQIAFDLLSNNDSLIDVELKRMIRAELKTAGCSSAGLTGFYAKLVQESRIQIEQNRISMREENLHVSGEES